MVIYPVDSAIQRLNNRGQDWGKSPLNTGWAEKPAKGFFIPPWNLLKSLFQAAA